MRAFAVTIAVASALASSAAAGAASILSIRGAGYGHGIGMSQYGAYGYALHGKSYRFILGHYFQGTALGATDPAQVVRVLIGTGQAVFSGATRAGSRKLNPRVTYSVRALRSGRLGVFTAGGKRVTASAPPLRVAGSAPLRVAGHGAYSGTLEFRPDGSGGVETINIVGLEEYVRGVVPDEMPANWSAEALKAQAVAARTYAITAHVAGNGFELYSDTRSQMYGGVNAQTAATNAAVAATRGQVVTFDGSPVITYFFSSSGGHTEDVQNVFLGSSPEPWLRGVKDPFDGVAGNPYHRWTVRMSMAVASAKLGSLVKGKLLGIRVTRRGVSPRVISAEVVGTEGKTAVSGPQLQQALGLRSTWMSFSVVSGARGKSERQAARLALARAVVVVYHLLVGAPAGTR